MLIAQDSVVDAADGGAACMRAGVAALCVARASALLLGLDAVASGPAILSADGSATNSTTGAGPAASTGTIEATGATNATTGAETIETTGVANLTTGALTIETTGATDL